MKSRELKFSQIHDIFGVRIITETVDYCYRALGCIHNLYKPIPGRFKIILQYQNRMVINRYIQF